jgi:hypothetical protein
LEAVEEDQARVDAHHDSLLRDEEALARAKTRLTMHDNRDGTVSGHFTVPTLAGAILPQGRATAHLTAARAAGCQLRPGGPLS